MATVASLIGDVDLLKPNSFTLKQKRTWLSDLDLKLAKDACGGFGYADIFRVQGQAAYDLPDGVSFDAVAAVYVNKTEYPRIDCRSPGQTGYYQDSSGKLGIYPVPAASDTTPGLRVVYRLKLTAYTANETLLLGEDWEELYRYYLMAMIDFHNQEYEGYNNNIALFNARLDAFLGERQQIRPVTGGNKIVNIW